MLPPTLVNRRSAASLGALATCLTAFTLACHEIAASPESSSTLLLQLVDTGSADGASVTEVVVAVMPAPAPDAVDRTVTVTTTAGALTATGAATAQVRLDATGHARTQLRAPRAPTTALVSARAGDSETTHALVFRSAQPDLVEVTAGAFALEAGIANDIEITARLRRSVGHVSPGVVVSFGADTGRAAIPIGRFSPATSVSDSSGVVKARFTTADSTLRGPVRVRASVSPGEISGSTIIEIVKP